MMDVTLPDGTVIKGVPDGMSKADLTAKLKANGYDVSKLEPQAPPSQPSAMDVAMNMKFSPLGSLRDIGDAIAGSVRGAGSIGATIAAPYDVASDLMAGKGLTLESNRERRNKIDAALAQMGANPNSANYQGAKLATEVGGTLGVGGAAANGLARIPGLATAAPGLINAVRTSGMAAGSGGAVGNALARVAGGAVTGGLSAGLVNPEDAKTGALVGGVLPIATQAAGAVGSAIGNKLREVAASPEVAALAARAKELGIDIPADRIVNSKPLDAIASGLNYVPFSGRSATEAKMGAQLNTAASKLMGQDTPNINKALRAASNDLGAKFDTTLRSNGVAFDQQLLSDIANVYNSAEKELGSDSLKAITSQVDELVNKGASGTIDGQAAYNIKRTLDRIGSRNTPEAYHALELKGVLMDALNRSLGPTEAAAFATTRQQYGNMLALEKLAKNGVEGEISIARLANMKNINNQPLQELADIAAQFVKAREGQHGAMQRAVVGLGAGVAGGAPGLAATVAGGRGLNTLLNSNAARSLATGAAPNSLQLLANPELQQFGYRTAPVLAGSR